MPKSHEYENSYWLNNSADATFAVVYFPKPPPFSITTIVLALCVVYCIVDVIRF